MKPPSEKADHALATLQDIAVDAKMVRDTVNAQTPAADAFTAQMIATAPRKASQRARYMSLVTRWAAQWRKSRLLHTACVAPPSTHSVLRK
ncbi:hypothetical protein BRN63_16675 [Xanthomonas oryzae pv. oryzae]|nr:hypothetical protein BRM93_00025 [Xanthomonas oryzae pv. oryzae]RBG92474.1 hypothetical protein BRM26_01735 [Xanthomonas oryzae pv. oryzae]RBK30524.1 hypothetical protein BRN63_16675 [Xanthomonas oryzae pv. oryzae]